MKRSDYSQRNKRIAKNTFLLYMRMILLVVISLYTSRVILNALGVVDYGIYNVVGGIVTMFSMVSGSLSTAISRFLTFAIGEGRHKQLNTIFSTSVNIQLVIAFFVVLLAETVGLWFLNVKMVIPEHRMSAAFWVYQFSILSFATNLISIPYNAIIIAHERMSAFAYISIFEAIGKLVISFCIAINPLDRLIYFALMMAVLSVFIRFVYSLYCRFHFPETAYHFIFNKDLLKEMFGFAGWNFLGSSAIILREQGGNIIINLFCGPAVNASRAIATKVNTTVQGFITNFTMAINPQITKSYAAGEFEYMHKLIYKGTRLSFYMMLLLSLPIMLNTHYIMNLWLGMVPEHTVSFVRLILLLAMCDILSNSLITTILATGHVRNYQIVVSSVQLLNLPISYLCLRLGCWPETVIIIAIIISNAALLLRLLMIRQFIKIEIVDFLKKVYLNAVIVGVFSSVVPMMINVSMKEGILRFLFISIISILNTSLVIYYIGCNKNERMYIKSKVRYLIDNKLRKK